MSNMNDQYEQMGYFRDALIRFNDSLRASMRDLEKHHQELTPIWRDDDTSKDYHKQWQPLDEMMQRYIKYESLNYVEFLSLKHEALGRYLGRK